MSADVTRARVRYRDVTAVGGWWSWALVTAGTRLADAAVPLSLVLYGGSAAGSDAVGGLMSGAYAISEAVAAPWLGARLGGRRGHGMLTAALIVRGVLLGLLVPAAAVLPGAWLVVLAVLAGAAAAGAPGALRALLTLLVDRSRLHRAMSLDTLLLELSWVIAPAIVAVLAGIVDAGWAVAVTAVVTVVSGLAARTLPVPARRGGVSGRLRLAALRPALVSLALGLVGGVAGGALDTAVPPRLAEIGSAAALAGILFTGYSIASVVGGLAFGARSWPGSPHRQAQLFLWPRF